MKKKEPQKQYNLKEPFSALQYVEEVVKKRFPPVEDVLITEPQCAAGYAIRVLRDRWKEAENVIRQSNEYWRAYLFNFHERFTKEEICNCIQEAGFTEEIIAIFNCIGMKRGIQRFLVQKRPDLIDKIKKLDSRLKKKYNHEISLSGLDI